MKVFGVDITAKYIIFEVDGKEYLIQFRISPLKGVYDISVWIEKREIDAKVKEAYPPHRKIIQELWKIHFPNWLKWKIKRSRQLHNQ